MPTAPYPDLVESASGVVGMDQYGQWVADKLSRQLLGKKRRQN